MRPLRSVLLATCLACPLLLSARAATPPVVHVTQPLSFTLSQGSNSWQIQAVERSQTAASFYDYSSASSHTGFELAHESKLFLFRDTTTSELSLFFTHNIDGDLGGPSTGPGAVTFDLTGVPVGAFVAQSDDPGSPRGFGELDLGQNPEGQWNYQENTDGGVIGGLPTNSPWCITVDPVFFSNVTSWVYHFASGASIALDQTLTATICFLPPLDINVLDVDEGLEISVSGWFDDVDAGDTHVATWDFDDGTSSPATFSPGVGSTHHDVDPVFHTYGDDGEFAATLSVADSAGLLGSDVVTVRVHDVAPFIVMSPSLSTSIGTLFSMSATSIDPGSDDLTFTWDFGDGTPQVVNLHLNDGVNPDPFPSPAGNFPFNVTEAVQHYWCEVGDILLTLNVADDDGLSSTAVATVHVAATPDGGECNEPPECEAGPDVAQECDGVLLAATATDPDGDALVYSWTSSCPGTSFSPGPDVADPLVTFGGECAVTCVLSLLVDDLRGGTCTDSLTVALNDVTAPVLAGVPAALTIECSDPVPGPAPVTASDNCDSSPSLEYAEVRTDGTCTDRYTLTRTWTATDNCLNTTTATQVITVRDTVAPVLAGVPANATASCENVPSAASPTASDNCDPAPGVAYAQIRTDGTCLDRYTLTRTWTATDRCGNSTTRQQIVTVIDNTKPSLIGVPAAATVECDAVPVAATVTATDNCDPGPSVAYAQIRTDGTCLDRYTLTRTWTATDRCGNSTTGQQLVTVRDTVAPVLAGVPADDTVECDAVPAPATPTASDNCDPSPSIAFAELRTDGPCPGTYTLARTWTATDRCANSTSATQVLNVQDTTPPVVAADPDGMRGLWPPNHKMKRFGATDFAPTFTDNCSEPVLWHFVGCASDQPDDARESEPGTDWNGDGHTTGDCVVAADGTWFEVRAERCGTGPTAQAGRHYAVTIVATDACGNDSAAAPIGSVHVPHDQGR